MQRKDVFAITWKTIHVNASLQGDKSQSRPVNHATHERVGLTEHILSISFLLEYSFLKNREKVEICSTLIKKRRRKNVR